jgi:hypothetical protein
MSSFEAFLRLLAFLNASSNAAPTMMMDLEKCLDGVVELKSWSLCCWFEVENCWLNLRSWHVLQRHGSDIAWSASFFNNTSTHLKELFPKL